MVGALVGGKVLGLLGVSVGYGLLGSIISAFVGAVLLPVGRAADPIGMTGCPGLALAFCWPAWGWRGRPSPSQRSPSP